MKVADRLRNSRLLRHPLLAASRTLFSLLRGGPPLLRRAAYDAMPVPYLVTGHPEHFVVSTTDKVIGREVFLHGEFDFAKLQTALAILAREGHPAPTHLIDVGANIGTITIPALKRGLIQTATAIEPHPHNLRLLRANIALNGLEDRVTVLAQAVGDRSGVTLHLHESATNSGNHSIGAEGIPVPSSKLDDLDLSAAHSLLWMDIEGYEGHALAGAERLLSTGTPAVCEFNPAYLEQSGGLELLKKSILSHKIFDLKIPNSKSINLEDLTNKYRNTNDFTDIIILKAR